MIFRKRRFRVLLVTLICDEDLLVGSHKGRKLSKLKKKSSQEQASEMLQYLLCSSIGIC
jgi:hypothetical protein